MSNTFCKGGVFSGRFNNTELIRLGRLTSNIFALIFHFFFGAISWSWRYFYGKLLKRSENTLTFILCVVTGDSGAISILIYHLIKSPSTLHFLWERSENISSRNINVLILVRDLIRWNDKIPLLCEEILQHSCVKGNTFIDTLRPDTEKYLSCGKIKNRRLKWW